MSSARVKSDPAIMMGKPCIEGAQRQRTKPLFFQDIPRRLAQGIAQVAVVVAAYTNVLVHGFPLSFSMRAKRLDVSQRRPPIASTSA